MSNGTTSIDKITTDKFRVSFPSLFVATAAAEGQEKKFGLTMIIPKTADIGPIKELLKRAIIKKWPDQATRPTKLRNPIRDGDKDESTRPEYAGCWFITAKNKTKPGLVDQNLQKIIDTSEFYAGCYARATLTAFAYDTKGNKGVSLSLQNVQKLADGEPFSGRARAEDDFGPVATPAGAVSAEEDLLG